MPLLHQCYECKKLVDPIYQDIDGTYQCKWCIGPTRRENIEAAISMARSEDRRHQQDTLLKNNMVPMLKRKPNL